MKECWYHEDSIGRAQTSPVENTSSCSFVRQDASEHGIPLACASSVTNASLPVFVKISVEGNRSC